MPRLRSLVLAGGGLLAVLSLWRAGSVTPTRVVDSELTVSASTGGGVFPQSRSEPAGPKFATDFQPDATSDIAGRMTGSGSSDLRGDGGGASLTTPGIVVPPPYDPVAADQPARHETPGTSAAEPSASAARITFVAAAETNTASSAATIVEPHGAIQPVAFEQPAGVETRGMDESRHGRSSGPRTSGFAVLTGRIEPFHDEP